MEFKTNRNFILRPPSQQVQTDKKIKFKNPILNHSNNIGQQPLISSLSPKVQSKNACQSDIYKNNNSYMNRLMTTASKLQKFKSSSPTKKQGMLNDSGNSQLSNLNSSNNQKIQKYLQNKERTPQKIRQYDHYEDSSYKEQINKEYEEANKKKLHFNQYNKTIKVNSNNSFKQDKQNLQYTQYLDIYQMNKAKAIAEQVIKTIQKYSNYAQRNVPQTSKINKNKILKVNQQNSENIRPLTTSSIVSQKQEVPKKNLLYSNIDLNSRNLKYDNVKATQNLQTPKHKDQGSFKQYKKDIDQKQPQSSQRPYTTSDQQITQNHNYTQRFLTQQNLQKPSKATSYLLRKAENNFMKLQLGSAQCTPGILSPIYTSPEHSVGFGTISSNTGKNSNKRTLDQEKDELCDLLRVNTFLKDDMKFKARTFNEKLILSPQNQKNNLFQQGGKPNPMYNSYNFDKTNFSHLKSNNGEYVIGQTIGQGAYAYVLSAKHKQTNQKFAIKIYEKSRLIDPHRKRSVNREIQVLQKLKHPNIANLHDVIDTESQIQLVMEYVDGPSLQTFLKKQPKRKIEEQIARKIILQILEAISYCHQQNITHRDIKLENILLKAIQASNGNNYQVKLIDFGFSTDLPNDQKIKIFCGTPSYMAPEIVARKEHRGPPVDIWAIGVLMYAMICGYFPFRGSYDKELYRKIIKGEIIFPEHVSEQAQKTIRSMVNIDPNSRPTSQQLINNSWVQGKSSNYNNCVNFLSDGYEIIKTEKKISTQQIEKNQEGKQNAKKDQEANNKINQVIDKNLQQNYDFEIIRSIKLLGYQESEINKSLKDKNSHIYFLYQRLVDKKRRNCYFDKDYYSPCKFFLIYCINNEEGLTLAFQ